MTARSPSLMRDGSSAAPSASSTESYSLNSLAEEIRDLKATVKRLSDTLDDLAGSDYVPAAFVPAIALDAADDFIGANWYGAEKTDAGVRFRWSGPGSLSTIKLPLLRSRRLKALVEVENFAEGVEHKFRVFVDGQEIPPISMSRNQLRFIVPARKTVSAYTEIGLLVSGTTQAKNQHGEVVDPRWLGFAFRAITVTE